MLRRDLVALCDGARDAGLYSSLITAGTLFTRQRAEALKAAGLDHVQISIQSPNARDNDRIAGNRSFEKKIAAARLIGQQADAPPASVRLKVVGGGNSSLASSLRNSAVSSPVGEEKQS